MKSFLSGRPSASVPSLKPLLDKPAAHRGVSTSSTASGRSTGSRPPTGGSGHAHEPSVECVKQGDKVTHLIVTCACGERIEIDCLYAGPA